MGVFSDLRASAKGIDFSPPAVGVQRAVAGDLAGMEARIGDAPYPSGYEAKNEVHSIAIYIGTVDGGTQTYTVTLADGTTFTTAGVAYNANAATIEGAINTAASGVVDGWTNGDISVAGGPLTTTPVTLTFDGASVAGKNHGLTTIDDANLTGGGSAGAVTTTTEGQEVRTALAILQLAGVLAGNPPTQGESTAVTSGTGFLGNPNRLEADTVRALAREAEIADGIAGLYVSILTAANLTQ